MFSPDILPPKHFKNDGIAQGSSSRSPCGRGGGGGSDGGSVGSLRPDWVSPPRGSGLSRGGGSHGSAVSAIVSASPIMGRGEESHIYCI